MCVQCNTAPSLNPRALQKSFDLTLFCRFCCSCHINAFRFQAFFSSFCQLMGQETMRRSLYNIETIEEMMYDESVVLEREPPPRFGNAIQEAAAHSADPCFWRKCQCCKSERDMLLRPLRGPDFFNTERWNRRYQS